MFWKATVALRSKMAFSVEKSLKKVFGKLEENMGAKFFGDFFGKNDDFFRKNHLRNFPETFSKICL